MATKVPRNQDRSESGFASGLFWGAALGAAGMFFFGTKKGKKLRKYLSTHGQKILEELEEAYEETKATDSLPKLAKPKKKLKAEKTAQKEDVGHIEKLQEHGRNVAGRFFTKKGKSLKR